MAVETGAAVLKALRESRTMTQYRLAKTIGCDHSYISRMEKGNRIPHREFLPRLVRALRLNRDEADRIAVAFGYAPGSPTSMIGDQPEVARIHALMTDESIPNEIKHIARAQLALIASSMEIWSNA